MFLLKLFKLQSLHLLAGKEFEETRELLSIKSPIDISKTARFSWRHADDTRFLLSHGIEKIQRFPTSKSLHVPVRKSAIDRIAQENQQFDFRVVFPNPFRRWFVINVTGRAITGDSWRTKRRIMFV